MTWYIQEGVPLGPGAPALGVSRRADPRPCPHGSAGGLAPYGMVWYRMV